MLSHKRTEPLSPMAKEARGIFDAAYGPLPDAGEGKDKFNIFKQIAKVMVGQFFEDDKKTEALRSRLDAALDDEDKGTSKALDEFKDDLEKAGLTPKSVKDIERDLGDAVVLDLSSADGSDNMRIKASELDSEIKFSYDLAKKHNPGKIQSNNPELSLGIEQADIESLSASIADSVSAEVMVQVIDQFCDRGFDDLANRLEAQEKSAKNQTLIQQFTVDQENKINVGLFRDSEGKTSLLNIGNSELNQGRAYKMDMGDEGIEIHAGRDLSIAKERVKEKEKERGRDFELGLGLERSHSPF